MATFTTALSRTLLYEGGYVNDPDDPGGETYKGIARNIFGKWEGWTTVDQLKRKSGFPASLDRNQELQASIELFFRANFWDRIKGDDINDQDVANSIFDFAVNAGAGTSCALVQHVVEVEADGVMGKNTIGALNEREPEYIMSAFTVAKIARYLSIVNRRPSSRKFFYGWVSRALNN